MTRWWAAWLCLLMALGVHAENAGVFTVGELRCVIGNNESRGEHQAGYNGLFELTSIHQADNLFVPTYSGLNLEHIVHDRMNLSDPREFFEPRHAPMHFTRVNEQTARLEQPPTPITGIHSETTFTLQEPHSIDVRFTFTPTRSFSTSGTFGFFWASYINAPLDKSLYMLQAGSTRQEPRWWQFCTQRHNQHSTVLYEHSLVEWMFPDAWLNETLFTSFSPITYSEPFYYGRFRNMVWIVVFETHEGVRFAHSPSGGGRTPDGQDTNPAWDFQWIIPRITVDQSHSLRYRVIYKPWAGRTDVLQQVHEARQAIRH